MSVPNELAAQKPVGLRVLAPPSLLGPAVALEVAPVKVGLRLCLWQLINYLFQSNIVPSPIGEGVGGGGRGRMDGREVGG